MSTHDIHPSTGRQEIRCRDCGHIFAIDFDARSSHCERCGNIEYHGEGAQHRERAKAAAMPAGAVAAGEALSLLTREILERRVLPRLGKGRQEGVDREAPLRAFASAPDGARVEALRMAYQVEWQLWAKLVENFSDPAFHYAYVCQAAAEGGHERSIERYREHGLVMGALPAERWQAEIADFMLERLQALLALRFDQTRSRPSLVQEWLSPLPWDSRLVKAAWLMLGVIVGAACLRHFFR